MKFCQSEKHLVKIFVLISLLSCSHEIVENQVKGREITAKWMKIDKQFSLRGLDDEYLVHPFFDIGPNLTKEAEIRYVPLGASGIKSEYNLDLLSGAIYKERSYCATDDVWDSYSGTLNFPNYALGFIPRTYNQNNEIQKIIVFNNSSHVGKFEFSPTHYEEARIVGSVILDECDSYPCSTKDRWKESQILVAVAKADPFYNDVKSFGDLKKKVNWDYTKAFLNNGFGSHQVGSKYFPAFRIDLELSKEETIKAFEKRSHAVRIEDQLAIRDNCLALYNEIWTSVVKIHAQDNNQQEDFLKFFKKFYAKDAKHFNDCQKIVRPANINENAERHWFFTFIQAFINLEQNGLYYSCNAKAWAYNPRVDDTHFYVDQNKELNRCRARDLEKAFDQSINGIGLMKNQLNHFFRYIEYDSDLGGSHQKIYSWISTTGKKIPCEKEYSIGDIFPQDVVWQSLKEDEVKTVH